MLQPSQPLGHLERMQWLAIPALALCLFAIPAQADEIIVDGVDTQARFHLRLALSGKLEGRFTRLQSTWQPQGDGQWRVQVSLPTRDAEIPGHAAYTRIMRGERFFDSQRYPEIHFVSEAFEPGFLARGGALPGVLTMRGVARRAELQFAPSTCRPPLMQACVIDVRGEVSRRAHGMTALPRWVEDAVLFHIRIAHGDRR